MDGKPITEEELEDERERERDFREDASESNADDDGISLSFGVKSERELLDREMQRIVAQLVPQDALRAFGHGQPETCGHLISFARAPS